MKTSRRSLLLAGAVGLWTMGSARAETWPGKPIRLVLPNAPGSSVDNFARQLMPPLSKALGQTIFIDNIPGSGGLLGMSQLLRSPKDGYTIGMVASNFAIAPNLYKLPYDSKRDVQPISILSNGPMVLVVNPKLPVKTLAELIAYARSRPANTSLTFGNAGIGTTAHLAGELVASSSGAKFLQVPYKGNNTFVTDLMGGQLDLGFIAPGVALPYVTSGRLRAIGLSTPGRFPLLPGVPSLAEAGLPNFNIGGWQALIAPSGLPVEILKRLNAEVVRALKHKELEAYIDTTGSRMVGSSIPEAEAWFARELDSYAKLAHDIGLKPE